ncbi:hypothetical protein DYI37_19330 [Fulvimarina endophytica]|uniref:PepSY domain-containing protein n=1 Tax=Fulvimarina endophytica TaxID=2293836 RepID=A0A371WXS5_9HYPH|nr:hypothetical protein DYI37_19330 [Fulvimarina endophytica]
MKLFLFIFVVLFALGGCVQTQSGSQSYGNDMLVNPQSSGNLSNDMLPSAEVTAFQQIDRRLGYSNARIEYDSNNCAVYQGMAPNGRIARVPLKDRSNQQICSR